jgi:hypothetical protein
MGKPGEFQTITTFSVAGLSDPANLRSIVEAAREAADVLTEGSPYVLDTDRVELRFTGRLTTTKER